MGQSTQECKHLTLELSLVNILHHYLLTLQYNKRQTIRPDVCAFMSVFGLNFKLPDSPLLACLQVKTYFTWEICLSYTHAHTHTPVADVVSQALSPRHPFYNIHPSGVRQTHPYKHTQVFRCTAQGEEAGKQTEACSHEKRAMLSLLSLSPAGLAETQ